MVALVLLFPLVFCNPYVVILSFLNKWQSSSAFQKTISGHYEHPPSCAQLNHQESLNTMEAGIKEQSHMHTI
jgi:tRNA U34 2-thiouridine synthase MnmA/TrmU